ncbi:MAG: phospholipase D-like domain-containing protein [Thermotogota bacterium]|nr:phospholipase D-like domain-containing protein [Thermotogota bacterium]
MRPFLLILLTCFTILIVCSCDDASTNVFFRGDFIKEQTLSLINNSHYTLDICVYSISDEVIVNTIEKKAQEGVRVRICTDNAYPLNIDKVSIVYDSGGLMHNKYMISDERLVWFGSTNLTPTSLEDHENNIIISDDINLIQTFQNHFNQCFSGLFKTERTGAGSPVLKFSPEEDCFDFLLNELSKAQKTVYIAMFAFSDNRIAHYLKVLSSKGVKIHILADKDWNLSSIYSDIDDMARYSSVRMDVSEALLHEKFIVIDERVLLTGSYNYTASAQTRNDEFLYKSKARTLVKRFTDHFLNLWEASDPK